MAYTSINKPSDYFNTNLRSGTGGSTSVSNMSFAPDLVWIKSRSDPEWHQIFDKTRGALNRLASNESNAEYTLINSLTSFNSDGYSLGSDGGTNGSGKTFVDWTWLAGSTGSSNTNGSITSTVSANTTSGFSIVSYTGTGANATVGHGLGQTLDMLIVKNRDTAKNWRVWFKGFSGTERLQLDTTDAKASTATSWNGTVPSSSVFSLGADTNTNNNTDEYIAYCFAEKKGFSKFGSYTGNGSADGPFIYTGFKPAFLLWRRSSLTENWFINDNKRAPFNDSRNYPDYMPVLYPNLNNSEGYLNDEIDMLSNGYKIRGTNSAHNTSGASYIYMAFAESPFTTSTGVPTTAR